ncbi:hypothetical protein DYB35_012431 [Aphanomyces astaci]|uniref:Transposase Tc1-like domain-containing protein n=1 Tax=Aphanomyces astaci TaxID=112090 RepID=A0A418CQG4_APHAT|nr:hypothetical protein DYB35_012431 [Aphanomyces astaci]
MLGTRMMFGLRSHAARKKSYLSKVNKKKRLAYAKKYQHWADDDWKNVIFTGESPFNLTGSSGRVFDWRQPGEEFNEACLVPTFKSGPQSLRRLTKASSDFMSMMMIIEARSTEREEQRNMREMEWRAEERVRQDRRDELHMMLMAKLFDSKHK